MTYETYEHNGREYQFSIETGSGNMSVDVVILRRADTCIRCVAFNAIDQIDEIFPGLINELEAKNQSLEVRKARTIV